MKKTVLTVALLAPLASSFALGTGDFSEAVSTATTVATTLNQIFFAVIPIALVVGLSIWGYRMAKRLAR